MKKNGMEIMSNNCKLALTILMVVTLFTSVFLTVSSFAQDSGSSKMTNDKIMELVSAGISEAIIIQSIQNANVKEFDLSPNGLISLKKAKVPDSVILAMQGTDKPDPIRSSILNGETVTFPIKYIGWRQHNILHNGTLSISKFAVVLNVPNTDYGFKVPTNKIFTVESKNFQLHMSINLVDAFGREYGHQVYLWDPGVSTNRNGQINVSMCGDSMDKLVPLLEFVKKLK